MSKKNPNFIEKIFGMLGLNPFTTHADLNFMNLQNEYFERLFGISVGCVLWENLPKEIDTTILERTIVTNGCAIITFEEVLEQWIVLTLGTIEKYNMYGRPENYTGITLYGGVRYPGLNSSNSVIIYDTTNYCSSVPSIMHSAANMANIRMTMNSNLYSMRKPVAIKTSKENLTSAKEVMNQYDNYEQAIFMDKSMDTESTFEVFDLKVQSFLSELRQEYSEEWNEALTKIGIPNIQGMKRERMITDEVNRLMGGAIAQQYVKLQPRIDACKLLSELISEEIKVSYREGFIEDAREIKQEDFDEMMEGGDYNE